MKKCWLGLCCTPLTSVGKKCGHKVTLKAYSLGCASQCIPCVLRDMHVGMLSHTRTHVTSYVCETLITALINSVRIDCAFVLYSVRSDK